MRGAIRFQAAGSEGPLVSVELARLPIPAPVSLKRPEHEGRRGYSEPRRAACANAPPAAFERHSKAARTRGSGRSPKMTQPREMRRSAGPWLRRDLRILLL